MLAFKIRVLERPTKTLYTERVTAQTPIATIPAVVCHRTPTAKQGVSGLGQGHHTSARGLNLAPLAQRLGCLENLTHEAQVKTAKSGGEA
ncbi:hypothetical protein GCM10008949_17290 [Deinococcus humi]|nr:hypothetical protein GCM10008949_17290 [Deinococcus humi]